MVYLPSFLISNKPGLVQCDGCSIAVVAFKIKVERFAIGSIPHQPFEHADHLGAFFIDGGCVKIVDFYKAV